MPVGTMPFDSAQYFSDPKDEAELAAEAFATGDAENVPKAVDLAVRAQGVACVVADARVTREGASKALAPDGDSKLSIVLSILGALRDKLSATLEFAERP